MYSLKSFITCLASHSLTSFPIYEPRYERLVLNGAGALLLLPTHAAIEVVYCHYMLTRCVEYLWHAKYVKF